MAGPAPSPLEAAVALAGRGMLGEALAAAEQAVAAAPASAEVHEAKGNILAALGRASEALTAFAKALACDPRHAGVHFNRANVLHALGRDEDAVEDYARAIVLAPGYVEAHANRAAVLHMSQRYGEAVADFRAVTVLAPSVSAFRDLADACLHAGDPAAALMAAENAVTLDEADADARYTRANVLAAAERFEDAVAGFTAALKRRPAFFQALSNRAMALRKLHRFGEALADLDQALALAPDNPELHSNRAHLNLLLGNLEAGFLEYEWRWRLPGRPARQLPAPRWTGREDIKGRTILLHAEQGFGDTLQFCRFAALVAARGARVVLEVQPQLAPLLRGLAGVDQVIAAGDALPPFDVHLPLLSLPLELGITRATIPAEVPYLQAPEERIVRWSERLTGDGVRAAIVWTGATWTPDDRERSAPLAALRAAIPEGVQAISLVREPRAADVALLAGDPSIIHPGEALEDFADTAAVMSLVDVVITVDTAAAHLAGALGLPVWLLAPHTPDWRWLLERTDSPWYPTLRIFRQPRPGDWPAVMTEITRALEELRDQ